MKSSLLNLLIVLFIFVKSTSSFAFDDLPIKKKKNDKDSISNKKESPPTLSKRRVELTSIYAPTNECVSYGMTSLKKKYEVNENVEIKIALKLYDLIPTGVSEQECSNFSIAVALPSSFTQTGGDYENFMNINLTKGNPQKIISIIGKFGQKDSTACFKLMKGPLNSNSSTIFIAKKDYCIESVNPPPPVTTNKNGPTAPVGGGVTTLSSISCSVGQYADKDVVCLGETVRLTAPLCTGPTSWRRINPEFTSSQIISSTTNVLEDIPPYAGIWQYEAPVCNIGLSTCPSGGVLNINVKTGSPQSVVAPVLSPSTTCGSSPILTTNNCTGTVHWYVYYDLSAPGNTQLFVGNVGSTSTTQISLGYTVAKCEVGCTLSDESNKVYNNYKTPSISASSTNYCYGAGGSPVTLTAAGCEAWQTYVWSNGTEGAIIQVNPQVSSSYWARCVSYDVNGLLICDNGNTSSSITINVNNTSVSVPTVSPAVANICSGESSNTTLTCNFI